MQLQHFLDVEIVSFFFLPFSLTASWLSSNTISCDSAKAVDASLMLLRLALVHVIYGAPLVDDVELIAFIISIVTVCSCFDKTLHFLNISSHKFYIKMKSLSCSYLVKTISILSFHAGAILHLSRYIFFLTFQLFFVKLSKE